MDLANKFLFNQYLNKKASAVTEAKCLTNNRNTDMQNLHINLDNINTHMATAIKPHIVNNQNKMTIANTDVKYVEELIRKNKLKEARNVMENLKSVARIITDQIVDTDCFLKSMEV